MVATYLLVPMMPTPNGPLHLGHIAGPYLKMDVLRRYFVARGDRVAMVTTTDAFDSYVVRAARDENCSVREIARKYHAEIGSDFRRFSIDFDAFVDPMSPNVLSDYRRAHQDFAGILIASGAVERTTLSLANADGIFLEPFETTGGCAMCSSQITGFSCEACGFQNWADSLEKPTQHDGSAVTVKSRSGLSLIVESKDALSKAIAKYPLPTEFRDASLACLYRTPIRLTAPGNFGIGFICGSEAPLYNTYLAHALFCSELAGRINNCFSDAFSAANDVVTVTSLGLDNCADIPASLAMALASSAYRPFDHYLGNFFLDLNGGKFSTSRDHAIFVGRLSSNVYPDSLRLYLALMSPESKIENFDRADYIAFHNRIFLPEFLRAGGRFAAKLSKTGGSFAARARGTAKLNRFLSLSSFSLQRYAKEVSAECASLQGGSKHSELEKLQHFLAFASPLLPNFCRSLGEIAAGLSDGIRAAEIEIRDLPIGRR